MVGRNRISIHVLEVIDDGVTSLVGRNNIISMHASTPEDDTPVIYHAVVQKYSHTQEVVVASFIVWLIGIESACMHPPEEDDSPGIYQAVLFKEILPQQRS